MYLFMYLCIYVMIIYKKKSEEWFLFSFTYFVNFGLISPKLERSIGLDETGSRKVWFLWKSVNNYRSKYLLFTLNISYMSVIYALVLINWASL